MNVIGLMSGTSLDGIDAVLVKFSGSSESDVQWSLKAFVSEPYAPGQRRQIHDAIVHGTPADLCRLHADLGEWFAAAALAVCKAAGVEPRNVDMIGSHGQTIWHIPPAGGQRGATLQLGDPATIAERTGIAVVSDFRARDVAAGGEGAPLVPWQDRVLFSLPGRCRVLQNIGGIANLTWLPPKDAVWSEGDSPIFVRTLRIQARELGQSPPAVPLLAFDTGPGNVLIDAAVELATKGREIFDRDGCRAARGRVDEGLLAEILAHPFFQAPPPKSTGRELFGRSFVEQLVERQRPADLQAWDDLVATLTAVTAESIAYAIACWVQPRSVAEIVVSGGGGRNATLMAMIRHRLAPIPVVTGEVLGINPDAKEAMAFAALAWAYARGFPGNVPEATGACGPRLLGSYTPGRNSRP